jgi:2-polyprenyl-6-methoxyphenol hydroxylase-like FAD-dependent oxidoreductase
MADSFDVVIIGGGIAGSALAAQLAKAGKGVLVLEQQLTYKDKVRGETFCPWGVRELVRMGLDDVALAAGGEYASALAAYDEVYSPAEAEARPIPYSLLTPDVPGALNVGHPEVSQALADHAEARGATFVRGVSDIKIVAGSAPAVSWTNGKGPEEAACRLVVGADGRTSTVRRQLGMTLSERDAVTYGAGLLVEGDAGFSDQNAMGTEGDVLYLAFPRAEGKTRLYLFVDIARQRELTGPDRLDHFRAAFSALSFPASAALAEADVAGPCGGAPMTDSWTDQPPVVEGAVLIGDAAGWNDPIIGQGLSIAARDARTVADVLNASDDWSAGAFTAYVAERADRMRRLAASARIHTAMRCTFTPEGRERRARWLRDLVGDPTLLMQASTPLIGPEAAPAEVFEDAAVEATLRM